MRDRAILGSVDQESRPETGSPVAAVIVDIVQSRAYPDQSELFDRVGGELDRINDRLRPIGPLAFTVGDELQGVMRSVPLAMDTTLLLQLHLSGICRVRCGIGWGEITAQGGTGEYRGQSGSAWWRAREALDRVARSSRAQGWPRTLHTWIEGPPEVETDHARAFLLCRDELLDRLDELGARIALGLIEGRTQQEIADQAGITQSSVAHRIARSGLYSLVRARDSLLEETT